jgi:hypothetical protein
VPAVIKCLSELDKQGVVRESNFKNGAFILFGTVLHLISGLSDAELACVYHLPATAASLCITSILCSEKTLDSSFCCRKMTKASPLKVRLGYNILFMVIHVCVCVCVGGWVGASDSPYNATHSRSNVAVTCRPT